MVAITFRIEKSHEDDAVETNIEDFPRRVFCHIRGLAFARFPNSDYYGIAFDFGIFPEETLKVKRSVYGITLSPLVLDTADVRRIGVNGSLWIMSIESTGLGVSVIHWEDCVKGLQVGLLSAGALDVDGLQVGFVTGFGLRTYQLMPALPQVRGGQIGVFNLAE